MPRAARLRRVSSSGPDSCGSDCLLTRERLCLPRAGLGLSAQTGGGSAPLPAWAAAQPPLYTLLLASLPLNPKVPSPLLWTESQEGWLLLNTDVQSSPPCPPPLGPWSVSLFPAPPSPFPFPPLAPLQASSHQSRPCTAATGRQSSRLDPGPCPLMSQGNKPREQATFPGCAHCTVQRLRLGPRPTQLRMLPSPPGGGCSAPSRSFPPVLFFVLAVTSVCLSWWMRNPSRT